MEVVRAYEITRIEDGRQQAVQDTVVVDFELMLRVNGQLVTEFLCLPGHLEELVSGYLFGRGLVGSKSDLQGLTISGGLAEAVIAKGRREQKKAQGKLIVRAEELLTVMEWFAGSSELFAATGAVHACALWEVDGRRIFMEDIGRHNAVDKALGRALLAEWDLSRCCLLTSGRVSSELIGKALHTGVPVIVSRAAPMAGAVELARRHGLTLCGFVRKSRMNIYSAPERIVLEDARDFSHCGEHTFV